MFCAERCPHDNADHLTPGEWLTIDGVPQHVVTCEQFRCLDCGYWLSLGPSSESEPEVKIEIRAAQLAAELPFNAHDNERFIALTSFGERRGWAMHKAEQRGDTEWWFVRGNSSGPAGYLARCIATHEEEGK
jgi:hypothetical protein